MIRKCEDMNNPPYHNPCASNSSGASAAYANGRNVYDVGSNGSRCSIGKKRKRLTRKQLSELKQKCQCHKFHIYEHWASDHNLDSSIKPNVYSSLNHLLDTALNQTDKKNISNEQQ